MPSRLGASYARLLWTDFQIRHRMPTETVAALQAGGNAVKIQVSEIQVVEIQAVEIQAVDPGSASV